MVVVVDVNIEDEVCICWKLRKPVVWVFEASLQHDGDARVDFLDVVEDGVEVFGDPCSAFVGEDGRSAEEGHVLLVVVGGFVDGCEGVGVGMG